MTGRSEERMRRRYMSDPHSLSTRLYLMLRRCRPGDARPLAGLLTGFGRWSR